MTLGQKLKELRKEKGLTLEQLADIFTKKNNANYYKTMISLWENDKREPSMNSIRMYTSYFKVSLDWLLDLTKDKYPTTKNIIKATENKKETLEDTINKLPPKLKQELQIKQTGVEALFFDGEDPLTESDKESLKNAIAKEFIKIAKSKGKI